MPQLTWLVTGTSSGFGEQFVHSILAKGDRVIATARRGHERLQHLKDAGAAVLDLDVTAPQAELDAKAKEALNIYGGIDVLVNNAGYIEGALIEELEYVDPYYLKRPMIRIVLTDVPSHLVLLDCIKNSRRTCSGL